MFCHENLFNPTKMFLLLIKLYPSVILSDVRRELATEDESKDPENISLTTPRQGVLTKICPALKGAFSFPRLPNSRRAYGAGL